MIKVNSSDAANKYLWGITFKEAIAVTFFGVLIAVSNLIRIPMHIPGHTGLVWISILTFCCLTYRKAGAGTLAGIVSGFLATVFVIGNDGPFVFFKYFLPGLTMDLIFSSIAYMASKWYLVAIVAAVSHWMKLFCNYIIGSILNLPQGFLITGLKITTINHFVFGFCGGLLAFIIYSRTKYLRSFR